MESPFRRGSLDVKLAFQNNAFRKRPLKIVSNKLMLVVSTLFQKAYFGPLLSTSYVGRYTVCAECVMDLKFTMEREEVLTEEHVKP